MPAITSKQIPWTADNVIGHSIDHTTGRVDLTEGFGAFDSVLETGSLGRRLLDIGGGAYDFNSAYVANRYFTQCSVYDPFKREPSHNSELLQEAHHHPFDAACSFSILNVIDNRKDRLAHIKLCQKTLKIGGKAIFKAWPGDQSGIGKETSGGYQSNRGIESYLEEIASVFGKRNTFFNKEGLFISCINRIDRTPAGHATL